MSKLPRRPVNALDAAEALFKPKKTDPAPTAPRAVPSGKEMVSLRIDNDVLAFFQDDGPGWQERINDALRAVMERT